MSSDVDGDRRRLLRRSPRIGTRELLRRSLVSGVAIVVPLVVTLAVLGLTLNVLSQGLNPVVGLVQGLTPNRELNAVLIELTAAGSLLCLLFVLGFLAEFGPGDGRLAAQFDDVMASIPGIGSVYSSFDEMSDLLLDSDTDSFQEVKLVEYPVEGSYTVAFKTAESTAAVTEATGHDEMVTLFMPMAPNPVMGGFVIHVSADRVLDVDMTVEEGVRSIVTSGVTVDAGTEEGPSLSARELRDLGVSGHAEGEVGPGRGGRADGTSGATSTHGEAPATEERERR